MGTDEAIPNFPVTILSLPPITVLPGQIVELDAYATAFMTTRDIDFSGVVSLDLRRDIITLAEGSQGRHVVQNNIISDIIFNPSVMWVDSPPPGTYVYNLVISVYRGNISSSSLRSRGIRAKVYNTA